jgi:hypothetical protein
LKNNNSAWYSTGLLTIKLLTLHDQLSLEGRDELMLLDTTEDRTIYFDLLPLF